MAAAVVPNPTPIQEEEDPPKRGIKKEQLGTSQTDFEMETAPFKTESTAKLFPLLDGSNYRTWQLDMRMHLMQKGLGDFITEPPTVIDPAWDAATLQRFKWRRDAALGTIFLGITPTHKHLLGQATEPLVAWQTLKNIFEPKSRAHIAAMMSEYMLMCIQETESIELYISRVDEAVHRLRQAGQTVPDSDIAYKLLTRLPESYMGLVSSIYQWIDADFTSDRVKKSIIAHSGFLRESEAEHLRSNATGTSVHNLGGVSKRQGAIRARGKDSTRKSNPNRGGAGDNRTCFRCHKPGHLIANCPVAPKDVTSDM